MLKASPNSSPNCAPKGLQFVLSAPVYSIDNIASPGFTTALLTEGLQVKLGFHEDEPN
jgi:hypothetical protein